MVTNLLVTRKSIREVLDSLVLFKVKRHYEGDRTNPIKNFNLGVDSVSLAMTPCGYLIFLLLVNLLQVF